MEKLAYQLWKKDDDSLETFKELLLKNLSKDIAKASFRIANQYC